MCFSFFYFVSFYQGFVPAHGGYVWTSPSNTGEQITGESQKNSCVGNGKRDIGEGDKQYKDGITGINVRKTAELFITKIVFSTVISA